MTAVVPSLLRLPDVLKRVGLSRSEVYRRIAAGTFPRPRKLGRNIAVWVSTEIDAWIIEALLPPDARDLL
ncbi:MAG: AlpA family phage regulatory protein [Proteobacteria bacterium]|nr:AlpA family phage regulatory protein [Pseudomonadota bacterium]